MSVEKVFNAQKTKVIGYQARVRSYRPLGGGRFSDKVEPLKQTFDYKAEADQWHRERLDERSQIAGARRSGKRPRVDASDRTVRDLANYYFQHSSFAGLEAASKERIRGVIERFLNWNDQFGRPYASQWTRELADRRMAWVLEHHEGGGILMQNAYVKILFKLDLLRDDPAIERNPFPPLKSKTKKRSLMRPRAYSDLEMAVILECSEPYERALWQLFANTGLRSEEMETLPKHFVLFNGGAPDRLALTDTKNDRDREIPLNADAQDAVTTLLALADDSEYLIRRDWIARVKERPFLRAFQATQRVIGRRYPQLKPTLGLRKHMSLQTRTTVHTFRKTFATNLIMKARAHVTTVADLLGDDVATVMRHYAAILTEDHRAAVDRLSSHKNEQYSQSLPVQLTGNSLTVQ